MRMALIPIMVSLLGTVSKCLESSLLQLQIRRKIETMQITVTWFGFDFGLVWFYGRLTIVEDVGTSTNEQKKMTMHKSLHQRDYIDRLYASTKRGENSPAS